MEDFETKTQRLGSKIAFLCQILLIYLIIMKGLKVKFSGKTTE